MISKLIRIINTEFGQWICERYEEQQEADRENSQMQLKSADYQLRPEAEHENSQMQLEREKLQDFIKQMQFNLTEYLKKQLNDFIDMEYFTIDIKEEQSNNSQYETKQLISTEDYHPAQSDQTEELSVKPGKHAIKHEIESDEEFIAEPPISTSAASSEPSDMQPECSKEIKNTSGLTKRNVRKQYNYAGSLKQVENYFICTLCPKSTKYSCMRSARQHMKQAHLGFRFYCKQCDYNCGREIDYRCHKKNVHEITPKAKKPNEHYKKIGNSYKCTLCTVTYQSHYGINEHIKTKHLGFRYKCENCNREFVTRDQLIWHKRTCKTNIE